MTTVEINDASVAAFWERHGGRLGGGSLPPQFWFGDSPAMADELGALVRSGPKRATAGLLRDVEDGDEPMPEPGQLWIVVDGSGEPVAVIRTSEVRVGALSSVTEQFAWDEGEGDRTRAWWLEAHRAYFARQDSAAPRPHDPDPDVVFERFAVVWPPASEPEAPRPANQV